MRILDISLHTIADTRGNPTIEVRMRGWHGITHSAQVPSGKSTGKREAAVLSFKAASRALKKIKSACKNRDFASLSEFDTELMVLDGTREKKNLGGNLMLGCSIAFALAFAAERRQELWQAIHKEFFPKIKTTTPPRIFANLIEGGVHTKNNLQIQEYLAIVETKKSVAETVHRIKNLYAHLGEILRQKYGNHNVAIGDEGGYSLNFPNNFEPIRVLETAIRESNFGKRCMIGIDAAASTFFHNGMYVFENKLLRTAQLISVYLGYLRNSKMLYSIEDPFDEDDEVGFVLLQHATPEKIIVGDDLTVTDAERIHREGEHGAIKGVIIKPNQIGTLTETCKAIITAHHYRMKCIVSHRSGEVPDPAIIHIAKASCAFGVKIGSPVKSRATKYNELIRLF